MDIAQDTLKKVRREYEKQRENLKKLKYDADKSMKTKMKKYHELKKGYDNVSKKKYSDKAKNDAKKDVEKVFTQIKQLRSDFQRKIAKQQGVVRKAEYKFEQSLKAFDNRRVLVSKVQRRLPIQIASKEQVDATTSVCTATSYAHRYVMKLTTRADAQKKAEIWQKNGLICK